MELTPVESSHIAAIGYLEADRVLLVRYKDGALYAIARFGAVDWAALQVAPSKGSYLYAWDRHGVDAIRIPLEVIDENAGKCCRKALESARLQFFSGRDVEAWNCPTCATEFRREMAGPVAHWRIVEHFAVVRPR